ncbi:dapper homolog 2 isoform X1 [Anguilla anguilla]|uniref:dapper homolog 2 isoform X1 n=1 Tax=Anguilla anguilla TaxID=7936 RepID=UPI0015B08D58|nr:dapper homolog 2 isoform X1 [Anguilla anguilla]
MHYVLKPTLRSLKKSLASFSGHVRTSPYIMLSKKISGSGLLNAAAGIDRGRVGERLRAALAGLQELHFLKEKQRNMVFWALRMDREEPVSSNDPCKENPDVETEEQRLEATLTALKQQLSRLRRQDVGLKSHLQQLDQQISELKLDVCKVSSEHLETDSRPSSGFYDLSDGGSGSLSNSCTSVYSECLSSSQSSLLPPPCLPGAGSHPHRPPGPPEASRRRSADESAAQGESPRAGGVRLGSSWIRTGTGGVDRARQRPVSTGDLERILTLVPSVEGKKPSPCHNLRHSTVDPKYQSNLVSRGGTEVYRYPSPLHAVALQSPIFSLSGDGATPAARETAGAQGGAAPASDCLQARAEGAEVRQASYINKLLQRSLSKTSLQGEGGRDRAQPPSRSHAEAPAVITGVPGVTGGKALRPQDQSLHQRPVEMGQECPLERSQDLVNHVSPASIQNHAKEEPCHCRSYPAAPSQWKAREAAHTSDQSSWVEEEDGKSSCPDQSSREQLRGAALARKLSDKRPRLGRSASKEEGRGQDRPPVSGAQPEFVHAQFVPAGSQRVKVRQADRKTKAVRLRKRSCDKPRVTKQPQAPSEMGREAGAGLDRGPKQAGPARASRKLTLSRGEGSGRSCSETSLYGSAFPHHPAQFPPQLDPPLRPGKAHGPQSQDVPLADPARRKQVTRKWQSAAEMAGQRAQEVPNHAAARRSGVMPRSVSARPQSGQWAGHPYTASSSSSSSSYFGSYGSRYPPAPYPVPRPRYPPRSESEYSADCASLFHSTIAESSEGELSDFTANRFGDSESSCDSRSASDSDSSLSQEEEEEEEEDDGGEEGGLVWAEAALGPTAAGLSLQQPRAEPPACRIKASRALKKKIRHFQPAALKVMTLV